jgi:hypothetical protein
MRERIRNALMAIARKGYGWYLAIKVGKALLFPVYAVVIVAAYTVAVLMFVGRSFFDFLVELVKALAAAPAAIAEGIHDGVWFRGFSRAHYRDLYEGDAHDRD